MLERLQKYQNHGYFVFKRTDNLKDVCNAPCDRSGVYVIWTTFKEQRLIVYIGCSGRMGKDGQIIHRKAGLGGLKDRLVNGHQFGKEARRRSWPKAMEHFGLDKLEVYWYDTENDDPEEVEHKILAEVKEEYGQLPPWNSKD